MYLVGGVYVGRCEYLDVYLRVRVCVCVTSCVCVEGYLWMCVFVCCCVHLASYESICVGRVHIQRCMQLSGGGGGCN